MIYKKQDIDRIFTEKVSELLAQGFQINPATMDGSQGEIAHVDLRKGNELIRVLLENENDRVCGWRLECLHLSVGRCTEPLRNDGFTRHEIVWNHKLEILSEIWFASASQNIYDTTVYLDIESGRSAAEKRARRWEARRTPARRELPGAFKSNALRWLRKQKGFKTCRLDEIESVARVEQLDWRSGESLGLRGYEIKARGKTFELYTRKPA